MRGQNYDRNTCTVTVITHHVLLCKRNLSGNLTWLWTLLFVVGTAVAVVVAVVVVAWVWTWNDRL